MEFFNDDDSGFDIVMSDMLLAFKIMGRVHRENKYLMSERVRLDRRRSILGQMHNMETSCAMGGSTDDAGVAEGEGDDANRQMESCAMGDSTDDAGLAEGEGDDANTEGEDSIRRPMTQENGETNILFLSQHEDILKYH
jgi:hypothetical protein